MHELALAESTLDIAMEAAREQHASHIEALTIRIGPLSGVVDEALEFALTTLTLGTIAEGAQMSIEHVPLVYFCTPCDREFESQAYSSRCPHCGVMSQEVRHGREMDLVSIEVS